MKRRGPSNVLPVAPWMANLVAKAQEGTHTPDQIAKSLELIIAMGGDAVKVRSGIHRLALKAPLAHQPWVRKLDHRDDTQMLKQVEAFIDITNEKLAQLPQEEVQHDRTSEKHSCPSWSSESDDWDTPVDYGCVRRKGCSRRDRAVRAAKRGQA